MPERALSGRHAAIGRLLDEIDMQIRTIPIMARPLQVGMWRALLAFARAEWERSRPSALEAEMMGDERVAFWRPKHAEILTRLETALAPLMGGK